MRTGCNGARRASCRFSGGIAPLVVAWGLALSITACDRPADPRSADPVVLSGRSQGQEVAVTPRAQANPAPKIVVKQSAFTVEQLRELESAVPDARFVFVGNDDPDKAQLQEVGDADALLTDWLTPELVRAGKKLKWIQHYAAGVDDLMFPELADSDIVMTNSKIVQGPEIADHAFAMLLALTRKLNEIIPNHKKRVWDFGRYRERDNWPIELNGRTALVIGLGGIGMQVAQRAHAFGMKVIAIDPKDVPYILFVHASYRPDRLHELLPQADVIFVSAPLTASTHKMIGTAEFGRMKHGAYLIALSRGPIIDTDALVRALEDDRLAGAGLDVVDPEPLPKDHPLWKFENVILTPHMSGQSAKAWERRLELFKENARRFVTGAPLLHVVDKKKGY